jgi:hypothetical protein
MENVSVRCGCGRVMRQPGTSPRGTFACGCGARVAVSVSDRPQCIGLSENDQRCGFLPVREAAQFALSLCTDHFVGYLDVLSKIREGEQARQAVHEAAMTLLAEGRLDAEERQVAWERESREQRKAYEAQSVVYYVRMRDLIKIGYTTNMTARMGNLIVDEVLATEPGGEPLERMRHKQFAALKVRGERFREGPEFVSHIAMIREHYGEPVMTGYLGKDGKPTLSLHRIMQQRKNAAREAG